MLSASASHFTKNGNLRSCEPCQKSKVRCDHARPHCGRCISRNTVAECTYKSSSSNQQYSSSRPLQPASSSTPPASARKRRMRSLRANNDASRTSTASLHAHDLNNVNQAWNRPSRKYIGTTSFTTVFDENEPLPSGNLIVPDSGIQSGGDAPVIGNDLIRKGANVLGILNRIQNVGAIIEFYYQSSQFPKIALPILQNSLDSIQRMTLSHVKNESQLLELSERIFFSTLKPMIVHQDIKPWNYHSIFTGPHLRWEIVGIVLTLVGLSLVVLEDDKNVAADMSDLKTHGYSATDMLRASDVCIAFCDETESLNDLTIWLFLKNLVLRMMYHGDTSEVSWRRLGDLSTAIFAIGFHKDDVLRKDTPTFLVQSRRSCFAGSYYLDKAVATCLGRPPRLPIHYCETQLPLDLADEDMMDEDDLAVSVTTSLDSDGWNMSNMILSSTWTRVRFMIARVREEVLSISLSHIQPDTEQRASVVLESLKSMWNSLPPFLRYESKPVENEKPNPRNFKLLIICLDHTYSEFLLRRTLIKRTGTGIELLYLTARELLSLVVTLVGQRTHSSEISRDFAWVVLFFGLSSAAFLAGELLKRQQQNRILLTLPRADIIHDLSVFVFALGWVAQPGEGNYATCRAAQRVLKANLDVLINWQPLPLSSITQSEEEEVQDLSAQEFSHQDMILNDPFLDLFNASDWETNFWPFAM